MYVYEVWHCVVSRRKQFGGSREGLEARGGGQQQGRGEAAADTKRKGTVGWGTGWRGNTSELHA